MLKKNILITGGTGFIGFNLIKKLSKRKKIKIYSLSRSKPEIKNKLSNVTYLYCDISKKKMLNKILNKKKFDYVVNLAGEVNHFEKKNTFNSHYIGCKNIAQFFINKKIKKFIQMGSSVEYGKYSSPQKETFKPKLNEIKSTYGRSKLKATYMLLNYFKKKKFPVVIFRLYITFGPKQEPNRLIPTVITNCLNDKKFNCSNGLQYRDFIHVNHVVSLIIKALHKKNITGKIFNIGSGKPVRVRKVIELIRNNINMGQPMFGKIKLREDETIKLYPNISKLVRYFNFKLKKSFRSDLNKTIKTYKNLST